ncbi:Transglutaminase-like superfamily-domain-containing protein [Umbelopsis sp. AD052]|nr:Transglutaminase-like superfamily-domain-containing protein [Umbelopsis sp. AD052]
MFVEHTLQDIISNEETQCAKIILLADEYRTKALDILTSIYNNKAESSITERYYAGRIIHRIKKRLADDFWRTQPRLGAGSNGPPPTAPTYVGMAVLANAIDPVNDMDVHSQIMSLTKQFQEGYLNTPTVNEFEKVQRLVQFLHLEKGFGAADIYYDIQNSLIHSVLRHRRGIPLSLAVVFQAIAHATNILGVDIMSFPGHVVVRHTEPITERQMYIDLFQSVKNLKARDDITIENIEDAYKKCIFTQEQCENQLILRYGVAVRINAGPGMTPNEIYARCMRNIMNADGNTQIRGRDDYIRLNLMLTRYSTSLQMALSYPPSRLQLEDFCIKIAMQYHPEDIDLLSPWVSRAHRLNELLSSSEKKKLKRKPRIYDHAAEHHVWPVGTIIVKGSNGPCGVVIGWELHYDTDFDQPTTIHKIFLESTQVETLDFRPSLCDIRRNMEVAEQFCNNLSIGQYFSHFDIYQLRFVPNDILKVSYPADYTASPISGI